MIGTAFRTDQVGSFTRLGKIEVPETLSQLRITHADVDPAHIKEMGMGLHLRYFEADCV